MNLENEQSRGRLGQAMLEAMRPRHWIKNALVGAPLLFSGHFTLFSAWAACLGAMAAFCLLSSAVYLINDICDRSRDRSHPVKCHRPIASGRLPVTLAAVEAIVLLAIGAGLVLTVEYFSYDSSQPLGGLSLLVWTGLYVVLNLLYSFCLKQHPVVDVLAVAMGFVLRAMAGAAAISVPISPWLVVCTLTLCLFIAIAKRRGEILEVPSDQIGQARPANLGYTPAMLEHMMTVSATLAILTYSLYCLAPRTIQHVGSAHMIWTIPLVIYGMFRYYRIATLSQQSDPVALLIRDKVMWMVLGLYVILSGLVLNYGSMAGIRDILDA